MADGKNEATRTAPESEPQAGYLLLAAGTPDGGSYDWKLCYHAPKDKEQVEELALEVFMQRLKDRYGFPGDKPPSFLGRFEWRPETGTLVLYAEWGQKSEYLGCTTTNHIFTFRFVNVAVAK